MNHPFSSHQNNEKELASKLENLQETNRGIKSAITLANKSLDTIKSLLKKLTP